MSRRRCFHGKDAMILMLQIFDVTTNGNVRCKRNELDTPFYIGLNQQYGPYEHFGYCTLVSDPSRNKVPKQAKAKRYDLINQQILQFQSENFDALKRYKSTEVDRRTWLHVPSETLWSSSNDTDQVVEI